MTVGTAASTADDLLDIYSTTGIHYQKDKPLPDIGMRSKISCSDQVTILRIGSRLDKYWYRVTSHETYDSHILTVVSLVVCE